MKEYQIKPEIEIFDVDSITPAMELLSSVSMGVLEMGTTDSGWWAGTMPAGAVPSGSMPFAYRDTWDCERILWDFGLEQIVREAYAKQGVYLLTDYPIAYGGFGISTVKPVNSLAELKGKKIRGFGLFVKWLEKIGASPVAVDFGELYTALSTGTIDGVLTAWSPTYALKFYEVAPYGIQPSSNGSGCQDVIINLDTWNSLPADLQTFVQLTAQFL